MRDALTELPSSWRDLTETLPARTEPLVFVLVLNYQSLGDTIECVTALRASDYPNFRLLVIDNASPDDSGSQLAAQIPPGELLRLPTNTGYAGGNNIGMGIAMEAGAKYVFILNPDVRVGISTISECARTVESDPFIGAVNSVQLGDDGDVIDKKFRNAVLLPAGIETRIFQEETFPKVLVVHELLGAALFIPVRVIECVGGFDPLYFAYGEETDLCRRLRYHGFRLVVTGRAPIRHLRTKETTGVSDRVLFLRSRGFTWET